MPVPPINVTREPTLDRLAEERIVRAGVAPAAALGWARRDRDGWRMAVGAQGPHRPSTQPWFDLASVTKPFVALTAARLIDSGQLDWRTVLADWAPELAGSSAQDCPLEDLLSHRSGLQAHIELFAPLRCRRGFFRGRAMRQAASAQRPECVAPRPREGYPPVYSDLGYLLAGEMLERATGLPLDALVHAEVCEPLGLAVASVRQWLEQDTPRNFVPTEHVGWRGGDVHGVVHDENAWAIAGHGIAGHAGLFGTVDGVLALGAALLDAVHGRSSWLASATCRCLLAPRPGGTLRLGFDAKSSGPSAAGTRAGPQTFGHLGFTGTSLWCDPDAGVATALLTNRVRPSRSNLAIRLARPVVHDALFAAAE